MDNGTYAMDRVTPPVPPAQFYSDWWKEQAMPNDPAMNSIGAWHNPFRDKTDAEIDRMLAAARDEGPAFAIPATPSDQVHQPSHYARYTIEPATFIAANGLPFDVGNVVKYVLRHDAKNGREDLLKARRYIDMILERLDREDRVEAGESAEDVWKVAL